MKANRIKDLTNAWLKLNDYHWFYVITDHGKQPLGHVLDCVRYYHPYNMRASTAIELRIDKPQKFTSNWETFLPTHNQKRLALKGVFR